MLEDHRHALTIAAISGVDKMKARQVFGPKTLAKLNSHELQLILVFGLVRKQTFRLHVGYLLHVSSVYITCDTSTYYFFCLFVFGLHACLLEHLGLE